MYHAIPPRPEQGSQQGQTQAARPRIFISHSHADDAFGQRLAADLRRELGDDDAVWYDASGGLRGGEEWWDEIVRQISSRPIFLVVLSPDAMTSRWVRDEIRIAWLLKNSSDERRIIPILARPTEDLRADLRSLHIISFVSQTYDDGLKQVFSALYRTSASVPQQGLGLAASQGDIGAYWRSQGQPWRKELEISQERQRYLAERLTVTPDVAAGIFPFVDVNLARADVEWLVGQMDGGPVNWHDTTQQRRVGLDLRGADLQGADLSGLPLSRTLFGLEAAPQRLRGTPTRYELIRLNASEAQRQRAAANLENAILWEVHLEGACLARVSLRGADLGAAHLEAADLTLANLENADLTDAVLDRARLNETRFDSAILQRASLQHAQVYLGSLVGAQLVETHFEGADLAGADFSGADLRRAFFDAGSNLRDVQLSNARIVGTHWRDADLTTVTWSELRRVGDETYALAKLLTVHDSKVDGSTPLQRRQERFLRFQDAHRASKQLATALAAQGIDAADRFAYRAALLQRRLYRRQFRIYLYVGSLLLDFIVGYGYRPGRAMVIYLNTILGFALAYFALSNIGYTGYSARLSPIDALILSITAFHGRGFFPSAIPLGDTLAQIGACEAVIGLLVEIILVAAFSRRAFGR